MSNQQDNSQRSTSDVSAKEKLNTNSSGEPSADNVNVSAYDGSEYDDALSTNNPNADNPDNSRRGTSEMSAKEMSDTNS